jgi:xanthine dehydrogenase small subunit
MATIAGNFINASPIGDLTIFFLALDAQLILSDGKKTRELALRKLYKGYKDLDKKSEEYIEKIWFELPKKNNYFNFEKVSKRTHLDIASVNSTINISIENNFIETAALSAGGVGPIPLFLKNTSSFLSGKELSEKLIEDAIEIAQLEITPISDARGSEDYKRLLLSQLIKAHFITLFPSIEKGILAKANIL